MSRSIPPRNPYSIGLVLILNLFLLLGFSVIGSTAWSMGVYQEPAKFVEEAFGGHSPQPKAMFLSGSIKQTVKEILGHRYAKIRIRYWLDAGRSAWILDEIGKEKPITTGIIIKENKIEQIKVLVFRETRGWEVRHDFFTEQFIGATLTTDRSLNQHIDGITGATLSVRAVTNVARLALFLHSKVTSADA